MYIPHFLSSYSFEQILLIEASDKQFLALQNLWKHISQKLFPLYNKQQVQDFFLLMVLQNSLISYQIAGSGEQWWEEFSERLAADFQSLFAQFLLGVSCDNWFYQLMITSKYNKRLYNLKYKRLQKFASFVWKDMYDYYRAMENLLLDLSCVMNMNPTAKTMTFAVKMFGYAARLVYDEFVAYPMSIRIPVDSRIRNLWLRYVLSGQVMSDLEIQQDIQNLAEYLHIPPLHLDSLLRIEIWKKLKA